MTQSNLPNKFKHDVLMWTDGACSGNPGPGGWGVLMRYGTHEKELYGGASETTNNRMEMLAAIKGFEALKGRCTVVIHTDSKYVLQGMTEWLPGWRKKGWKTASGKPVKNVDLWQSLDAAASKHEVTWVWVKGHAGILENERADELARMGASERA